MCCCPGRDAPRGWLSWKSRDERIPLREEWGTSPACVYAASMNFYLFIYLKEKS